jgi:hypothetical protein
MGAIRDCSLLLNLQQACLTVRGLAEFLNVPTERAATATRN